MNSLVSKASSYLMLLVPLKVKNLKILKAKGMELKLKSETTNSKRAN